jgi:glycosyltransferase involved in cell wall biosynthesis
MRVALLASNVDTISPAASGTEQVVCHLANALVDAGLDVTLFATGDAQTKAKLVSVTDSALRHDRSIKEQDWAAYEMRSLIKLHDMQDQFDVVHNHMGYQALPMMAELNTPNVTTNHDPIKAFCAPIYLKYSQLFYVPISEVSKRLNYPDKLNYQTVIYNGIDTKEFTALKEPSTAQLDGRKYLLFFGRICRDKGTMEAIEIARKLSLPLIIAGKLDAADEPYFHTYVEPYLEPGKIDFIGAVDHSKKLDLFAGAVALLYPLAFDEPFGAVMTEAMAAGTPVMALERGSVREVLIDGKTAIIGHSVAELISRFSELKAIDPALCRQRAQEVFSVERMAKRYEILYEALARSRGIA